nr:DUF3662 domain-containing protein [Streptomyces sp. CT34]
MGPLTDFEHAMERWTSRCWAAVFRPPSKDMELVAKLRRVCDDHAMIIARGRTVVPNAFTIELPPQSHQQLDCHQLQLAAHLNLQLRRYAAERSYSFAGPVTVILRTTHALGAQRYRIRSRVAPHTRRAHR